MHREYLDEVLRRLATEAGYAPAGWEPAEIGHFRLLDQCFYAAVTEADLQSLRLYLRLQPSAQAGPRAWLVSLSSRRSLTITLKTGNTPTTAVFELLNAETEVP